MSSASLAPAHSASSEKSSASATTRYQGPHSNNPPEIWADFGGGR
jgi:hypothetical protein